MRASTNGRADHCAYISCGDAWQAGAEEAQALIAVNRRGPSVLDAIVMAFAAVNGGVVYTSEADDLALLREVCFPSVRVLGI